MLVKLEDVIIFLSSRDNQRRPLRKGKENLRNINAVALPQYFSL